MKIIVVFIFFISFSGCITGSLQNVNFDDREITVETLSLFNQRKSSQYSNLSWKSDWVFRRERLSLIDESLRSLKPDIFIAQEVMSKKESPSESDRNILLAGALRGYDWYMHVVKEYEDTQEAEAMAVAVGAPLYIDRAKTLSGKEFWKLGEDGYLTAVTVGIYGQDILIFNVQMPSKGENKNLWYAFIKDKVKEKIVRGKSCGNRVLIAGFLPGNEDSPRYVEFMEDLELKDAALGFCEIESRCYTSSSLNELYMSTIDEQVSLRTDRILVHQNTVVLSSFRTLDESKKKSIYAEKYQMNFQWASQRFGWVSSLRFASCSKQGN